MELLPVPLQADPGDSTAGVTLDVREGLLNDAEHRGLHFFREAAELFRSIECRGDAAALFEPAHKPSQARHDAAFVDHRRMEQIGERANLRDGLIGEREAL